jgi:hypothetical protein
MVISGGEDDMFDASSLAGVHRLTYEGAIDADGHILEPPDLWERYLDPKFRERALRIVRDPDGLEELEIDGRRATVNRQHKGNAVAARRHGSARSHDDRT